MDVIIHPCYNLLDENRKWQDYIYVKGEYDSTM